MQITEQQLNDIKKLYNDYRDKAEWARSKREDAFDGEDIMRYTLLAEKMHEAACAVAKVLNSLGCSI